MPNTVSCVCLITIQCEYFFSLPYYSNLTLCASADGHSGWRPHADDSTLSAYAVPVTSFTAAVLRSCRGHRSQYRFPLSDQQISLAHELYTALDSGSDITSQTIHRFLYSLLGVPAAGSSLDQWKCPLMCWLAISALREDGRFMPANDYTRVIAKWEYLLRNLHLHEAVLHEQDYADNLVGYVIAFPYLIGPSVDNNVVPFAINVLCISQRALSHHGTHCATTSAMPLHLSYVRLQLLRLPGLKTWPREFGSRHWRAFFGLSQTAISSVKPALKDPQALSSACDGLQSGCYAIMSANILICDLDAGPESMGGRENTGQSY